MRSSIAGLLLMTCLWAYLETFGVVTAADADAIKKTVHEACVKESSLSPDDIKRVIEGKIYAKDAPAASPNLQCYVFCYFKKFDVIGADGKPKMEAIYKFLDPMVKDKSRIKPTLEKCAAAKGGNACEMAFNFEKCIFGEIQV